MSGAVRVTDDDSGRGLTLSIASASGRVAARLRLNTSSRRAKRDQARRVSGVSGVSGAAVCEPLRVYGISRWQLSTWRNLARQGKLAVASSAEAADVESRPQPAFAALEVDRATGAGPMGSVVIEVREVPVAILSLSHWSRLTQCSVFVLPKLRGTRRPVWFHCARCSGGLGLDGPARAGSRSPHFAVIPSAVSKCWSSFRARPRAACACVRKFGISLPSRVRARARR